jgi:hypothetical protein
MSEWRQSARGIVAGVGAGLSQRSDGPFGRYVFAISTSALTGILLEARHRGPPQHARDGHSRSDFSTARKSIDQEKADSTRFAAPGPQNARADRSRQFAAHTLTDLAWARRNKSAYRIQSRSRGRVYSRSRRSDSVVGN